jgi:4,5-dihydroxyphthalate decarboxylase
VLVEHRLKIVLERRPHTAPLLDGTLPPPRGLQVEFVEVKPVNRAFRGMVRYLEFDICEMAVVTHYLARARGCPFLALPVFPARHFPHPAFECGKDSGIAGPADLAGKRVGSRSFTMTTAVWARGVLARQFGLDTGGITWVVADEEHVPGLTLPPNVVKAPGADLRTMLRAGDLQAGIGLNAADDSVYRLWQDPGPAEREWLARTGAEPVNHTVVVREELLGTYPGIGQDLYLWFAAAREMAGPGAAATGPYGMTEVNRTSLEFLLGLTRDEFGAERGLPGTPEQAFLPVD